MGSKLLRVRCTWVLCVCILIGTNSGLMPGCYTPPLECPNENITFWLYTRSRQENPSQLLVEDPNSINEAPFVKDAAIKILIHGYTGHKDYSPNTEIRPAYFERGEYNVISVDYNPIALEPCYVEAAHNIQLVGKCTAQLIDCLVDHGHALPRFHVIGFSLGGQTAGAIANYLQSGVLDRVTGLDPAMPLFITRDNSKKLDAGDARFVDVLHTNALVKGKLEQCGRVDFYANGGITQPGCYKTGASISTCDHARAPAYYAESITSQTGFYGTRCFSWIAYMMGWCETTSTAEEVLFGEDVDHEATGIYFFSTNSEPPYAQGKRQQPDRLMDEDVSDNNDNNNVNNDTRANDTDT